MKTLQSTLLLLSISKLSQAAVLSGTGTHLPVGDSGPLAPGIFGDFAYLGGSRTGTWTTAAQAPWVGIDNVTGAALGPVSTGTANFDFTTLPTGTLPVGTFFTLGDLDDNYTNGLTIRALHSSNNLLPLWLDDLYVTYGNGGGPGGSILATDTPGWTWDAIEQSYSFDGTTAIGNRTLAVLLTNNQAIATLQVIKPGTSYGFSLRAPAIPEPSSALLGVLASGLPLIRRKRSA